MNFNPDKQGRPNDTKDTATELHYIISIELTHLLKKNKLMLMMKQNDDPEFYRYALSKKAMKVIQRTIVPFCTKAMLLLIMRLFCYKKPPFGGCPSAPAPSVVVLLSENTVEICDILSLKILEKQCEKYQKRFHDEIVAIFHKYKGNKTLTPTQQKKTILF